MCDLNLIPAQTSGQTYGAISKHLIPVPFTLHNCDGRSDVELLASLYHEGFFVLDGVSDLK